MLIHYKNVEYSPKIVYDKKRFYREMLPLKKTLLCIFLCLLLCACQAPAEPTEAACRQHTDIQNDGLCDTCGESVVVIFDFYTINDLHGKIADADTHPGVDELTTYLKKARQADDNVILLSTGDMWQGSSESNMTGGMMMTDWMNELDFTAMALGNHEYDWGEDPILENQQIAEFPFLAINIYERATNAPVTYCRPSVMVESDGVQIGIIGAIGDCYSSISADKVSEVYFKTGSELTSLVKKEALRLRGEGADFIVYLLHDGYEQSKSGSATQVNGDQLAYYYDTELSNGYVDLVFEGHTHQRYILQDEHGVYHLQNGGDNKGISHVEVAINTANYNSNVTASELLATGTYALMEDDPIVEELMDKYREEIDYASRVLGTNTAERQRNTMRQLVADLYYEAGMARWGDDYDIVLGGGFVSIRSPGYLAKGDVTYGGLYSLFPFDNELVLCSIKGRDLKNRFFETDNDNYFIACGDYGGQVRKNIDPNATYYVVVDTYSSLYAPNKLTEVERYGEKIYARDLLAEYAEAGGFSN